MIELTVYKLFQKYTDMLAHPHFFLTMKTLSVIDFELVKFSRDHKTLHIVTTQIKKKTKFIISILWHKSTKVGQI